MRDLTSGEVAKICSVSIHTITKWVDGGKLAGFRLIGSGHRRVNAAALRVFLTSYGMPTDRLDEFEAKERAKT